MIQGVGRKPLPKKNTSTSLPKSVSLFSISKLTLDDKKPEGHKGTYLKILFKKIIPLLDSKQKLVRSISLYGEPQVIENGPLLNNTRKPFHIWDYLQSSKMIDYLLVLQ
jgi:hypothetical protein